MDWIENGVMNDIENGFAILSQWTLLMPQKRNNLFSMESAAIWKNSIRHKMPSWWRHQMEMFSALLAICVGNSPVTGEFPTQRPVTRSFDVFFEPGLNKRLSK